MNHETKEVLKGLHRITLTLSDDVVDHINCYMIRQSSGSYVLVDSGIRSSSPQLLEALSKQWGREVLIDQILLTHLHPDHFGGLSVVRGLYGAKVAYHREERVVIEMLHSLIEGTEVRLTKLFGIPIELAKQFHKLLGVYEKVPTAPDLLVGDGDAIRAKDREWIVVHTPGHSPGHVCLFDRENRVLLSGDHLLPNETPNVPYYPLPTYRPLESYLKSLVKVKGLSPRLVFPAHGDEFTASERRVGELIEHHTRRLRETLELCGANSGVVQIASRMYWSRGEFETLSVLDKWLAILETISHTEFLCDTGLLRRASQPILSYEKIQGDPTLIEKKIDMIISGRS